MIDRFKVAKVFSDKANLASGGVDFISNGEEYSPNINKPYILEKLMYGSNSSVGTASTDSDISRGVYMLRIFVPKINAGNKWQGLQIADDLQIEFPKFEKLNDSPLIMTRETFLSDLVIGSAHNYYDLDVRFTITG